MSDAVVEAVEGVGYFYLAFNCNEGPTADPQVREAVDYAFSMDDAVEQFVQPAGVRQHTPVPGVLSEQWEFPVEEWAEIPHERDVDRAKQLLDDAETVPDDWTAEILVPPDNKRENIGVSVGNGLESAGYSATVTRLGWPQFLEQYNTGSADDYNMYTLGWAGSPDPDTFLYFLFSQEQEGVTNGSFYRDDDLETQIIQARQATDREKRRNRYVEAITTILEQRVHVPSYNLRNSFGVSDRVQDFLAHPTDQFRLVSEQNNVSVQ
jgi:peptide/nickel transport system substrate-binding protein